MSDAPPRIELTVPRTTQYLGMVRKVVAMAAARVGFPREEVDLIELAVDEACSNAILYADDDSPATLSLEVAISETEFTIVLNDGGPCYDFEGKGNFQVEEQLGARESGGLGIYIIKTFMDEVCYEHSPETGSVITMTKLRPEVPAGIEYSRAGDRA